MAQALRPIYTAPTEEAAKLALEDFRAEWQATSPGAVAVRDRSSGTQRMASKALTRLSAMEAPNSATTFSTTLWLM